MAILNAEGDFRSPWKKSGPDAAKDNRKVNEVGRDNVLPKNSLDYGLALTPVDQLLFIIYHAKERTFG